MGGGASQNSSYAGVITGSGSFTKEGFGILTLTGDNDYSGGTTISAGGLRIEGTSTLASTTALSLWKVQLDLYWVEIHNNKLVDW